MKNLLGVSARFPKRVFLLPVPERNCCGPLHRCCCYPGLLTCLCFFCQLLPTFTVTWGPLGSQSMHRMGILAGICHRDRPSLSFGSLERFWAVCSSLYPSVLSAVYPSKHLPSHSPAHQSSQSIIHPSILLSISPSVQSSILPRPHFLSLSNFWCQILSLFFLCAI